jgi:hypothetical protein
MPAVYPIAWEPVAVTGQYRNLQRRDVAVWERWLLGHAAEFQAVAYDVALGGVEPLARDGLELSAADRRGWKYVTALKVDVLLLDGPRVWVVEVRPAASVSALGAALAYPLMLAREEPDLPIQGGGIVCEHLPADIRWLAERLRVRVWVV